MKLIVGYQAKEDSRLIDTILKWKDRIGEVYFAWPGIANGRSTLSRKLEWPEWELIVKQRSDLDAFCRAGIGLNLLLNGNCYGDESLARNFYGRIGDLVDRLGREYPTFSSVTTASPIVARFIRQNFPGIEIRASVNMEIGTREGIEYMAEVMDGFYVKRELNRHMEKVREFSKLCRGMGKKVYLLANSGCLNYCSARTFHDNLVSHESGIADRDNAYVFEGQCRAFLEKGDRRRRILQLSNWIRPEDVARYEGLVDGVKLATRVSEHPEMIVQAYASGRFPGNLLALTEPDFSGLYHPYVLSGNRMPDDFFKRISACRGDCAGCGYCLDAFDAACEKLGEQVLF